MDENSAEMLVPPKLVTASHIMLVSVTKDGFVAASKCRVLSTVTSNIQTEEVRTDSTNAVRLEKRVGRSNDENGSAAE